MGLYFHNVDKTLESIAAGSCVFLWLAQGFGLKPPLALPIPMGTTASQIKLLSRTSGTSPQIHPNEQKLLQTPTQPSLLLPARLAHNTALPAFTPLQNLPS